MARIASRQLPRTLALGSLITLFLAACAPAGTPQGGADFGQKVPVEADSSYLDVSPSELRSVLEENDVFLVNVHVPYEGEIPGTGAHIAYDQVRQQLSQFPSDRNARIAVYCRSGSMSAIAARALVEAGYTDVINLDGGFRAWQAQGYEFSD